MTTVPALIIAVILLALCLVSGMRIALALTLTGFVGFVLINDWDVALSAVGALPIASAAKFTLLVIPMFILLGTAAQRANLATSAFELLGWLLRRVPGGLAVATLLASAAFAAVSGSSMASIISIGNLAITEMKRAGYKMHVAAGVVGAAGTLGVLIPPSIILVLYGVMTGESIGALLMAGIGPGILTAVVYGIGIMIRAKRHPELFGKGAEDVLITSQRPAIGPGIYSFVRIGILFLIIIGGMYSGFFTAVEAAAVGAFVALLMVVIEHIRKPRVLGRNLWEAIKEAITLNGMVFALLIGGAIFSAFMVAAGAPQMIADALTALPVPGWVIVVLILIILIPMGMFLDGMSILLIMVPLTYPIVIELGMDGIWYGLLFVKLIEIGVLTPPLGVNAFVVAGIRDDINAKTAFQGVLWFVRLDIIIVALMFIFPQITLFIPSQMGLS
jgi:C4-dicarboxylate transporter DctM subunit